MALGKELGTFDLKLTSTTLSSGKKLAVHASANFEGTMTGKVNGAVIATMSVDSADGKDGSYEIFTRTFFDNDELQDAKGYGKTTHLGSQKWLAAGVAEASNGRSYAIKGEIDFPARKFTGTMFNRGSD